MPEKDKSLDPYYYQARANEHEFKKRKLEYEEDEDFVARKKFKELEELNKTIANALDRPPEDI